MNDCCGNPDVVYKTYNPGEIRLYGHQATVRQSKRVTMEGDEFTRFVEMVRSLYTPKEPDIIKKIKDQIEKAIGDIGKGQNSQIIKLRITATDGTTQDLAISDPETLEEIKSIGVIYGYSFEGHCYTLPKPKIMLLPRTSDPVKEGDCGYSPTLGYAVWVIDKLARVVVLDVRIDDLKTLVLDENLPGSRSPLAYSQHQALAPQRANRD